MSAFKNETANQEHQQVSQEEADPYDGADVSEYNNEEKTQFAEIVKRSREEHREWSAEIARIAMEEADPHTDLYGGADVSEYNNEEKKQFAEIAKRSRESRREWLEEKEGLARCKYYAAAAALKAKSIKYVLEKDREWRSSEEYKEIQSAKIARIALEEADPYDGCDVSEYNNEDRDSLREAVKQLRVRERERQLQRELYGV
jgi:hypothetical protein